MQAMKDFLPRALTVKLVTIALLVLAMLVPIGMVEGVIVDRSQQEHNAHADVTGTWGGTQLVAGPVLVLPYTLPARDDYFAGAARNGEIRVLPAELGIRASMDHTVLSRGIYDVPVYSSEMTLSGRFDVSGFEDLGVDAATIDWERAQLLLGFEDVHGIRTSPVLAAGDVSIPFDLAQDADGGLLRVAAPLRRLAGTLPGAGELPFDVRLTLRGSGNLRFAPLGDVTNAVITSSWPSPKFIGDYLPESREIGADGFVAQWQVPGIGRALPGRWLDRPGDTARAAAVTFGAELYTPVSLYRQVLRASSYAVLFVALTFVAWFLFEQLAALRLHPLQYLLVGFANALFFLLLLSLAEHLGFGVAYLLSASASSGTITAYSAAVLGERRRAGTMFAALAALYAYLYMTLRAESFAMLFGSLLLWVVLAGIMYLTRNIDWYRVQRDIGARGAP